jgi:NAD+-dependent protein deacetylase SIR2
VYSSVDAFSQYLRFVSKLHQLSSTCSPSKTHKFIGLLNAKGKLKRNYTQNVDGLEGNVSGLKLVDCPGAVDGTVEGSLAEVFQKNGEVLKLTEPRKRKISSLFSVPASDDSPKVVLLHGAIQYSRCSRCSYSTIASVSTLSSWKKGTTLSCPSCTTRSQCRAASLRRRLSENSVGQLVPSITLYEEPPTAASLEKSEALGAIIEKDLACKVGKVDLVLVMGTSLKVPAFCEAVRRFGKKAREGDVGDKKPPCGPKIRCVLVNREQLSLGKAWDDVFDYQGEHIVIRVNERVN